MKQFKIIFTAILMAAFFFSSMSFAGLKRLPSDQTEGAEGGTASGWVLPEQTEGDTVSGAGHTTAAGVTMRVLESSGKSIMSIATEMQQTQTMEKHLIPEKLADIQSRLKMEVELMLDFLPIANEELRYLSFMACSTGGDSNVCSWVQKMNLSLIYAEKIVAYGNGVVAGIDLLTAVHYSAETGLPID